MVVRATLPAAILIGIAAVFVPSARAFERSTVDGDPETPLFWRYRWVVVHVANDTCDDVPADNVQLAIARSMAAWNTAAEPCSDFMLIDGGYPTGATTNLDGGDADMENRVFWREDVWPEDVPQETLAITTQVYRRASGQIIDADIDLNGVHFYWTDTDAPGEAYTDVENTMTHELGHLLGLAHVFDESSTMYGTSDPGDLEKRSLAEDDAAGLCFVYPRGLRTPEAPVFPSNPLSSGCSASPHRSSAWLAIVFLAVLAALARRAHRV
jgi:hypothetical protein